MWIHGVIFAGIAVFAAAGKRWPKNSRKKIVFIMLAANFMGLFLTYTQNQNRIYQENSYLERKPAGEGDYTRELLVSVEGEEQQKVQISVPEQVSDEPEQESEKEEPLSRQEILEQEIQQALQTYNQKRNEKDKYYLPSQLDGKDMQWEQTPDFSGRYLAFLGIAAGAALLIQKQKKEEEKRKKRREQMMMDYPGLIMKLTLFIQAGMSVRKAFQKMAADYQALGKEKEKRHAYEEILICSREMEQGIPEKEIYERFGKRCGQVKYKTFSVLLIQNLKKGNQNLLKMLEVESIQAWEDRKRTAKVMAETAATKLIIPMIMMLLVVFALLLIPACLTFYST